MMQYVCIQCEDICALIETCAAAAAATAAIEVDCIANPHAVLFLTTVFVSMNLRKYQHCVHYALYSILILVHCISSRGLTLQHPVAAERHA
jgi:hypothetical protein